MGFVWMRKRAGRYAIVRQVAIDEDALEKIADIMKIPKAHRGPGTMYIAHKKPPPPPSGEAATRRRTRQRK